MANLLRSLRGGEPLPLSFDEWASYFTFDGSSYPFLQSGGTPSQGEEKIAANFEGYVQAAYKSNGIVFACITARQLLFSEMRFQYQRIRAGRPGDLFGTSDLEVLEKPWPGATTADLLARASIDVDLAGNFYGVRRNRVIQRLRPDWVTIVLGSPTGSEIDAEIVGYSYQPGGPGSGEDPVPLLPEQVAHFAPIPDPTARYRGMSWLTPILEEIRADRSATSHKRQFFDHGAKLGYVVSLGDQTATTPEKFQRWVEKFRHEHEGEWKAYKTLFLAAGADVKTVGVDLKQLDFKAVQGAGETRICAAARVPAIIVGVSEGLESATYSNYGQARRAFADLTMRPMWRNAAGAFATLVPVLDDARLWFDDRDISFLQEDMKDEAEIQQTQANAIRTLVDAGYTADSVVAAVTGGDLTLLVHSGLFSVQLQPAGSQNGNGPARDAGRALAALIAPHLDKE